MRFATPGVGSAARTGLALCLAVQLACLPEVKERCRFVTDPTPAPALPADLGRLDALLIRRATEMTVTTRELRLFQVWWFRVTFAEEVLPILCGRMERSRELALAGRIAEAGRKYQSVLVISQVMQLAVAMHVAAQYADVKLQPGGQITQTLETFERQMEPILRAALNEDPGGIERALSQHPEVFMAWAHELERWPFRVDAAAQKARTAMLVWEVVFLAIATYEAAVAAAEVVASTRMPMPLLSAFAPGGAAAVAGFSPAASIELAEAIRRLIVAGALDAGVMVALSKTLGGNVQMSAHGSGAPAPREPPRINWGQQEKHLPGHNSHTPGRSTLTADPRKPAERAGTGEQVGKVPVGTPGSKERVDFGERIGTYIDEAGVPSPTTKGLIHYGNDGIHIVPAKP